MLRKKLSRIYSLPMEERNKIIERLRDALKPRNDLIFAVVFGSFLEKRFFHDVDLGLYLKDFDGDEIDAAVYAEKLSVELTRKIRIPVDVVVLNYAPMWLKLRALKGKTIIDKDPTLRLALKLATIDNYIISFFINSKSEKPDENSSNLARFFTFCSIKVLFLLVLL